MPLPNKFWCRKHCSVRIRMRCMNVCACVRERERVRAKDGQIYSKSASQPAKSNSVETNRNKWLPFCRFIGEMGRIWKTTKPFEKYAPPHQTIVVVASSVYVCNVHCCHLIIFFELIELTSISLTIEKKRIYSYFLAFFFNYQHITAHVLSLYPYNRLFVNIFLHLVCICMCVYICNVRVEKKSIQ